ncbi:MAG TPA: right-handed parallel beta-helix repeat-containing protein [Trichormus sp. M33_DOE_039]|nr:right-handed parallel beta-helix repeat-containing protein [Trichormus sp. M33_DOE_039]
MKILAVPSLGILTVLFPIFIPVLMVKNTQQNVNQQISQALQLTSQPSEPKLIVSVKDFGAIANDITDDTNAIQNAIDTVYKAGGGVVFFPKGEYKIKIIPAKSHAITIRGQVKLQGDGNQESLIKLADQQGNYDSIFAGERKNSDLSDFSIDNLAIDGNGANNPVKSAADLSDKKDQMRYAVRIFIGSRIHIQNSLFKNQNNANTITVNGNVSEVSIKNNHFKLIGGGKVDYDHSTIYTHGKRIAVVNNHFSSREGAGTKGARTAIEIHGDQHIVTNNFITGFTNGIYITGYAKSSDHQVVTDNVINEAHSGIVIWSFFSHGNTTNPAISNCYVANNQISLNIDGWRSLWGNTPGAGIALEPDSDAPIKNLRIINNQISFQDLLQQGRRRDNTTSGIRLWRDQHQNIGSENILISNNKINNPLASGIYISMPITNLEISKNTIVNPGKSNGNFHDDYRAAMLLGKNINNMYVSQNSMIDNQINNTMQGGIFLFDKCTSKCQIEENKLYVTSGKKINIYQNHYDK